VSLFVFDGRLLRSASYAEFVPGQHL